MKLESAPLAASDSLESVVEPEPAVVATNDVVDQPSASAPAAARALAAALAISAATRANLKVAVRPGGRDPGPGALVLVDGFKHTWLGIRYRGTEPWSSRS